MWSVVVLTTVSSKRRQEETDSTEDKIAGWHHQFNGYEFEEEMVKDREAWHAAVHGVTKSWT